MPAQSRRRSPDAMTELNLILLGPPGAGKGTQASTLVEDFSLPYIATGDILRAAMKDGTDLGKEAKKYVEAGELGAGDIIGGGVAEGPHRGDTPDGVILDGLPPAIPPAQGPGGGPGGEGGDPTPAPP